MSLKRHFVFPVVLVLAACTRPFVPPATVYVEAPALREYLSTLAPELEQSSVRSIRVCDFTFRTRSLSEAYSYAFIEFEDGTYSHTRLEAKNFKGNLADCRYEFRRESTPIGAPRKLQYLARKDVVANNMFNDSVRVELRVVAQAVSEALEAKKTGTTPAKSWGVENLEPSTPAP